MNRVIKRVLDVAGAGIVLVVLGPALAIVSLVIRISMGSPVFFYQLRGGYRGTPFVLIKFRTMKEATGPDGRPLTDAARLTPLGRFLRATSIDELPELWNVLRGDMSLVGPRPLMYEYMERYTAEQARRHEVRPGITGWAQVNGRNSITWEQKFEYDVWYVDHWSLGLDLRIFLLTISKVLQSEGISQTGEATAEAFEGTTEASSGRH